MIINSLFDKDIDHYHCREVHTPSEGMTNLSDCSYWSDHKIITIQTIDEESYEMD